MAIDATSAPTPEAPLPSTVWERKPSWIARIPQPVLVLAVGAIFVAIWQLAFSLELVSPILLPSPGATFNQIIVVGTNLLTGGYMLPAFWITTQEVFIGFAVAIVIGIGLGVIVGETAIGQKAIMPYLVAINTMPKVAFAPLFVAWLGFGIGSKVALAAFLAFFPIMVGTAAGLHAADANARMLFQTMSASRWQTLIHLKFPAGLPMIFAGLKNGAVLVVIGAIVGEYLGGGSGFGELVRVASSILDTARVFALIIYLSLLGVVLFALVSLLQRRLVFWHTEKAGGASLD